MRSDRALHIANASLSSRTAFSRSMASPLDGVAIIATSMSDSVAASSTCE